MSKETYLIVEPDGSYREETTDGPMPLEGLQKAVGGYVEFVRMAEDLIAMVNEEGRLIGLPVNQRFPNLVGPVVLGRDDPEGVGEFIGLPPLYIARIKNGDLWPGRVTEYFSPVATITDFRPRIINLKTGELE